MAKRKSKREPVKTARTSALLIRLSPQELERLRAVAHHYPPATWARAKILDAVEREEEKEG